MNIKSIKSEVLHHNEEVSKTLKYRGQTTRIKIMINRLECLKLQNKPHHIFKIKRRKISTQIAQKPLKLYNKSMNHMDGIHNNFITTGGTRLFICKSLLDKPLLPTKAKLIINQGKMRVCS